MLGYIFFSILIGIHHVTAQQQLPPGFPSGWVPNPVPVSNLLIPSNCGDQCGDVCAITPCFNVGQISVDNTLSITWDTSTVDAGRQVEIFWSDGTTPNPSFDRIWTISVNGAVVQEKRHIGCEPVQWFKVITYFTGPTLELSFDRLVSKASVNNYAWTEVGEAQLFGSCATGNNLNVLLALNPNSNQQVDKLLPSNTWQSTGDNCGFQSCGGCSGVTSGQPCFNTGFSTTGLMVTFDTSAYIGQEASFHWSDGSGVSSSQIRSYKVELDGVEVFHKRLDGCDVVRDNNFAFTVSSPSTEIYFSAKVVGATGYVGIGTSPCNGDRGVYLMVNAAAPTTTTTTTTSTTTSTSSSTSFSTSSGGAATTSSGAASTTSVGSTTTTTSSSLSSSTTSSMTTNSSSQFTGPNVVSDPAGESATGSGLIIGIVAAVVCIACLVVIAVVAIRHRRQGYTGYSSSSSAAAANDGGGGDSAAHKLHYSKVGGVIASAPGNYQRFDVTYAKFSPTYSSIPSSHGSPGIHSGRRTLNDFMLDPAKLTVEATPIGRGEYGLVLKGVYDGQQVAVKNMHQGYDDHAMTEFVGEAELMSSIPPHVNVVRFVGLLSAGDAPAIVTEFCEGSSLANALARQALDESTLWCVVRGVVKGMAHLAANGVAHRDLAARNVLLAGNWVAKISDFGMSRLTFDKETGETGSQQSKSNTGPLKWMAPEALETKTYSERSDVWMFGCLVVEALTRKEPYPHLTAIDAATKTILGTATPISDGIPLHCPPQMAEAVFPRVFAFNPRDRPTFAELQRLLGC